MKLRKLGNSDLLVSELGLGCMSLSPGQVDENIQLIRHAYDQGISYFDTADLYDKGANESQLGEAIQPFRQDIVLATKVGNAWKPDGSGWDWNASKDYILSAADRSLKRLKTDYIDLYQLHGGTKEDRSDEVIEAFELLVQQGKIRYYGISSIRPNVFLDYVRKSQISSNMMPFSVLDNRAKEYFDVFEQHNVSILVRGALAQGLLIDKEAKSYLDWTAEQVLERQKEVASIAQAYQVSNEAVVLQYVLQYPAIAGVVVGARTMTQLDDLLKAYLDGTVLCNEKVFRSWSESLPEQLFSAHRD